MIYELAAYAPLAGQRPVQTDVTHWPRASELNARIHNDTSKVKEKIDLFLTTILRPLEICLQAVTVTPSLRKRQGKCSLLIEETSYERTMDQSIGSY